MGNSPIETHIHTVQSQDKLKMSTNSRVVPPNHVLLHELLAADVQSIVDAASEAQIRGRLVRWASELSSASANALLYPNPHVTGPHADCQRQGRCVAKGSGRCHAGSEDSQSTSTNPTALLHNTSKNVSAALRPEAAAQGNPEDEREDGQRQKRRKLSSAEPWSMQEEISLLDMVAEMPRPPTSKEQYESLAARLQTGRSGPAVKQHCNGNRGFVFLASKVVSQLPACHVRHESHALPFKMPAWCDIGPRPPTDCFNRFVYGQYVHDRLRKAMTGTQPQQLQF